MKSAPRGETYTQLLIIALLQAIVYTGVWMWDEYVAAYLTIVFPAIILFILIIASIADLIEPSRIPGWYYGLMIISILIPVLIGGVFFYFNEGVFDWLKA